MGPRLWLCTSRQDSQPEIGQLCPRPTDADGDTGFRHTPTVSGSESGSEVQSHYRGPINTQPMLWKVITFFGWRTQLKRIK